MTWDDLRNRRKHGVFCGCGIWSICISPCPTIRESSTASLIKAPLPSDISLPDAALPAGSDVESGTSILTDHSAAASTGLSK
jgi:hypothetical protein